MIIETDIGNFGNFKDLEIYMRLENYGTVNINKAEWWGTNLLLMPKPIKLTYREVLQISEEMLQNLKI